MRLEGKSAVVTGSATGIGKAIAEAFAREGARVAIADVNLQGAEAVAHEIQSRKEAALPVQMDVSSEESVESAFGRVIKEFGSIDILLSNAGIQIIHPIVDLRAGRMHFVYGLGALLRCCSEQKRLCGGEARPRRPHEVSGERRSKAPDTRKHDLSRLCSHSVGRKTDS